MIRFLSKLFTTNESHGRAPNARLGFECMEDRNTPGGGFWAGGEEYIATVQPANDVMLTAQVTEYQTPTLEETVAELSAAISALGSGEVSSSINRWEYLAADPINVSTSGDTLNFNGGGSRNWAG